METGREQRMTQLAKLAKPFPPSYVRKPPQGKYGDYVPHHTVAQALLATVGPYDLRIAQVLYAKVPSRTNLKDQSKSKGALDNAVVGAIVELRVTIDGKDVTVQEAGDCEDPQNWATDGARLKDAVSDGLKRCAARIGLGLHLWSQGDYFLYDSLMSRENGQEASTDE